MSAGKPKNSLTDFIVILPLLYGLALNMQYHQGMPVARVTFSL